MSREKNSSSGFIIGSFWRRIFKIILVIFFFGPLQVQGEHISGGDITYVCTGGNNYDITLNLYRDCTGAPMDPQDLNFVSDCGDLFSMLSVPIASSNEVSQLCPAELPNSTCNGGTQPGIEVYQYTVSVVLPPCDSWTMSWDICCRNVSQNVQTTPRIYIEATLNNVTGPCNSSPVFLDQSIPYVCVDQLVSYGFSVSEPDGNTFSYSLISARLWGGMILDVSYFPPNSGSVPYPGLVIDPTTGVVTFTPTAIGNITVVVQIDEYDALGNLIGTIMKDMIFVVIPCSNQVPTNQGISNLTGLIFVNGAYEIDVCEGGAFCFDVVFDDANAADILAVSSTITALLPGATLVVSGTNPATATFCWTALAGYGTVTIPLVAEDGACPIQGATQTAITMNIGAPVITVDAGLDATVNSCSNSLPFDLYNDLGGTPDPGGTWTDPNDVAHSGTFDPNPPSVDVAGAYMYIVIGPDPCDRDTAYVTLSVTTATEAGSNGNLNICSDGVAVDLFTLIGGTPDALGIWTDPLINVHSGMFDPSVDVGGNYTYTVVGTFPCANASSTVAVNIIQTPDAGANANLTVCSSDDPVVLFGILGGTPDGDGTWTDPSNTPWGGTFDPVVDVSGIYTHTVTGTAPCADATATVTISVNPSPDAGTDVTIIVCECDPAFDLFTVLGGTPDGVGSWTDYNNVTFAGTFDPATAQEGVYTYTVAGTPPCPDQSATVTILMYPSTLPIDLALFAASVFEGQSVKVQWVTASENNNDHFTIEYSVDGVDWNVLTIIPGAGNSTSLLSYEFIHPDPLAGRSYYRLKQTDHNGTYTYSDIRSVTISEIGTFPGTASLEIFPNPSAHSITCNILVLTGGKYGLAVYDLSPRMLLYRDLELTAGAHSLYNDISSLSNGTYTIVLFDEQHDHMVTKLLMINK